MAVGGTCVRSVLFFALVMCSGVVKNQEEVVVAQGKLRGTTLTSRSGRNFSAFLGIPYARPPLGSLRFENPLPADSWNGTLIADRDGNQCPQYDDDDALVGHEDCLYLNVYRPTSSQSSLYPTMVYIHGGAFIKGNGGSKYVTPGFMMDKDIVLVAMNYRLGVLGFLSTGDAAATGNFGLKDQLLALRWVKENVREFGGDPNRVTLVGQSAGSVSVNLHVLSDASAVGAHVDKLAILCSTGLFNQYIALSGSSLCFWAYHEITEYKKHATDLGEYVNCPTNDSRVLIDCLRDIDVYTLVATNDIFAGLTSSVNTWVPTNEPPLEGAFLTTSPIDRILKKKVNDYPWIAGNVADEGLIVTAQLYANDTLYDTIASNTNQFLRSMTVNFLDIDDPDGFATSVKDFYLSDADLNDRAAVSEALTNLMSDIGFLFPSVLQMHIALQQTKNPFWFYSFEYRGAYSGARRIVGDDRNIGVTHTDDLHYIFPTSTEMAANAYSQSDEKMIDIMVDLWTSFVYNGVPTSNYTTDPHIWKPFDKDMRYLRIGEKSDPAITSKNRFHLDRMHFWAMQVLKVALQSG